MKEFSIDHYSLESFSIFSCRAWRISQLSWFSNFWAWIGENLLQ